MMQSSIDECAKQILETVPLVMRSIRSELRRHASKELSVPQFRTLSFLNRRKGASLSEVAGHIGLTLPTMSTLTDGLVIRNFAVRRTHPKDRRRMILELTDRGQATLRSARDAAQTYLAELIEPLSAEERITVVNSMRILGSIFEQKVS